MTDPPPNGPAGLDRAESAVVVREVACKSILNKSGLSDYALNCYVGCTHRCAYCYARYMQRFHPHPEPWGAFIDVKTNAIEVLRRQVARAKPGEVFVSSACDGWQPIERERRLTREACLILLEHGFRLNILTKSSLILRDIESFAGANARVGVTLTTLDEHLRRLWEPGASAVEQRIEILKRARAMGLATAVMFGPILPFLSDSEQALTGLFTQAAEANVDVIWVDTLNPRPKVWEAVQPLLRRAFPDLEERYRRILFAPRVREAYIAALSKRVTHVAHTLGLAGRLASCL